MQNREAIDPRSNTKPEIQKAKLSDVTNLLNAQLATFPDDPANLDKQDLVEAISSNEYRVLVAIYKSTFAGYIICCNRPYRPWTSLDNLIVLPEFAGRGIARSLLGEAMKSFHTRHFMRLFVEKNNKRAINLYEKNKFTCVRIKNNHYENDDDALIMYKFIYPHFVRSFLGAV